MRPSREELVLLPLARDYERGLLVALLKVRAPCELDVVERREQLESETKTVSPQARAGNGIGRTECLM